MRATFITILALTTAVPAGAQDRDVHRIVRNAHVHASLARAYQGRDRGPERTERFSRKVRIGRDGRVAVQNISGEITVTGGSGDEVSIEAVKRAHGDASQLERARIVVDDRSGRVDIRTEYDRDRDNNVSVDYTLTVPTSASVEVRSISGNVKVSNVQGSVRAESVSGSVTTSATPRLEAAKSVSGDIDLTNAGTDADLTAGSVSGSLRAKGLKARGLDLGTVSGDVVLNDVSCERLSVKTVSGTVEFSGTLAKNGRYDLNSHSGNVRLTLAGDTGFVLNANTFSGSIRSDVPVTIGGDPDANLRDDRRRGPVNHTIRATFGDGSASVSVRTFSGDIVIQKR